MAEIVRESPHPFEAVHEFQGTLSKEQGVLEDRHFIISHSTRQPSLIRGRILGEESEHESDLLSAIMRQPGFYASLRSKGTDRDGPLYESNKVFIRSSGGRRWPEEYGNRMVGVVAELEVEEFTCTHQRDPGDNDRLISFSLAGPRDFWTLHWSRGRSYTGETEFQLFGNPSLDVSDTTDMELRLEPHYVFSSMRVDDGRELAVEDYYHSLVAKTPLPPGEISDEAFRAETLSIVRDLLLIASVASRFWIDWFAYHFAASTTLVDHVRSKRERFEETIGHRDALVERGKALEFLGVALREFRNHRGNGFDLYLPLITVMAANTSEPLEQQFLFYFMSLEKLKDMYAKKNGLRRAIGSNAESRRFIKDVNDFLDHRLEGHPSLALVKEKTMELDRLPLWHVLERLLADHQVEWRDLYPSGTEKPGFIRLRNRMVHSSDDIDVSELYFETERIRVVLERMLLNLLGWKDTYGAASVPEAEKLAAGPKDGAIIVSE